MSDVNISKFRAQVVRDGSKPATPGFVVSEGQNPVDPAGSGQNHLPVTIGTPANGLAVTEAQVLTIDKAQIFAGTSSQFVKGDGTLDSTAYGTGSVTSVALTMPTAFSVANSPITTAGTLAVTATGTTAQYIRGDGSLATFPSLTGFVPYTGATADVNLGTHDLAAERGTFANNGSSDTLTVNHTSGSGYGIIVTKGGNNEALYVSKTSGSGNAMTVVGGRTSLVDLALSSVTNTAGDFLTLSGGVVHKRTAAQTLTDIGGQAALTNPVTGTGTTNYLPKFTGASTIGDSVIADNATEINIPKRIFLNSGGQSIFFTPNLSSASNRIEGSSGVPLEIFTSGSALRFAAGGVSTQITLLSSGNVGIGTTSPGASLHVNANNSLNEGVAAAIIRQSGASGNNGIVVDVTNTPGIYIADFRQNNSSLVRIASTGNLLVGTTTDAGFKLDVNGTGRFSASSAALSISNASDLWYNITRGSSFTNIGVDSTGSFYNTNTSHRFLTNSGSTTALTITSSGNVGIGTSSPIFKLQVNGAGSTGMIVTNTIADTGVYLFAGTNLELQAVNSSNSGVKNLTIQPYGGNVLIGTTTDIGAKLQVSGTGTFSGNVQINTNTTGLVLNRGAVTNYTGVGYLTAGVGQWFVGMRENLSSNNYIIYNENGTDAVTISKSNSTVTFSSLGTGTVYSNGGTLTNTNPSDLNLKTNVAPINYGLDEILKLNPVTFDWKNDTINQGKQYGFIAQEVQKIMPDLVKQGEYLGLDKEAIFTTLVKAIQELNDKIK
jgi:hypothetical protein